MLVHLPMSFYISYPLTTIPTWSITFYCAFGFPSSLPYGAIFGFVFKSFCFSSSFFYFSLISDIFNIFK